MRLLTLDEVLDLLPGYERGSSVYREVFKGVIKIFSYVEELNEYVKENTLISTANDSLDRLAEEVNVDVYGQTNREKIEVLRASYWALHGTIRRDNVLRLAKAFTNGDIEIVTTEEHGRYIFKFISIVGKPKQIDKLDEALKRMLNAGYVWKFEFKFNTWRDVRQANIKWNTSRTWKSLREEELN